MFSCLTVISFPSRIEYFVLLRKAHHIKRMALVYAYIVPAITMQ